VFINKVLQGFLSLIRVLQQLKSTPYNNLLQSSHSCCDFEEGLSWRNYNLAVLWSDILPNLETSRCQSIRRFHRLIGSRCGVGYSKFKSGASPMALGQNYQPSLLIRPQLSCLGLKTCVGSALGSCDVGEHKFQYREKTLSIFSWMHVETRGVSHCGLAIYIKKDLLRQKNNYGNSNISLWKNIIFKKSSTRNQNPSRYYNSTTNLKFQLKPKYHLSKILI